MIKLVVSDVDGTLVRENTKEKTEHFYRLSQYIRTHHVPFTIASGRSPEQMKPVLEEFGVSLPFIAYNGALLMQGRETVAEHVLPTDVMRACIMKADEIGISSLVGSGFSEYCFRKNAYSEHHEKDYGWHHEELLSAGRTWEMTKIHKVMFFDYDAFRTRSRGRADVIYEMLKPFSGSIHILRYDEYCTEAMPGGVSKGSGMRDLAGILGVPLDEVLAFGDSDNDVELLKECGIGAAVSGATQILKKAADYICRGSDAEGVLEGIGKFWTDPSGEGKTDE